MEPFKTLLAEPVIDAIKPLLHTQRPRSTRSSSRRIRSREADTCASAVKKTTKPVCMRAPLHPNFVRHRFDREKSCAKLPFHLHASLLQSFLLLVRLDSGIQVYPPSTNGNKISRVKDYNNGRTLFRETRTLSPSLILKPQLVLRAPVSKQETPHTGK